MTARPKRRTNGSADFYQRQLAPGRSKAHLSMGEASDVEAARLPLVLYSDMTPDLFEDGPAGHELVAAFEAFVATERERRAARRVKLDSTVSVYSAMWEAFSRFALGQRPSLRLSKLTADDLDRFAASRQGAAIPGSEPSARHVWRILKLLQRVLEAHANLTGEVPNRAADELLQSRPDWLYAQAAAATPLPEALSAADAKLLVNHLSSAGPKVAGRGRAVRRPVDAAESSAMDGSWQALRNRSAVALHLGAGLTPADVRALKVDSVVTQGGLRKGEPWMVRVPAHASSPARDTPLAPWAARLLARWLEVRAQVGFPGDWLYPSRRGGQPWSKVAHFDAVRSVLEEAPLDPSIVAGGAFRLRHTFALRQLKRDRSPKEVAQWLGVSEDVVTRRYSRVLGGPVVGVV
jgi:integrase